MSNRAILEVAVRLLGLYFLLQALLLLPSFLFSLYRYNNAPLRDPTTGPYLFFDGMKLFIFLFCFLFFLLRSGRLADLGAGGATDSGPIPGPIPDTARLPAILFSAVGVLVGSLAISDLAEPLLYIFTAPAEITRTSFRSAEWSQFAGGALQALLGVFLFLSGPRLARSWADRAET